jgi:hypothetical protein
MRSRFWILPEGFPINRLVPARRFRCAPAGQPTAGLAAGPARKVCASLSVFLLAVSIGATPGPSSARSLATVSVNVKSLGRVIPNDFDGFSIEVDGAAERYLGLARSPNRVFYQMLKNLGKGTIRIGGDSADSSCWNPAEAPHPADCKFTITQDAVNGYFKASAATGWGLIVDVNLAQNSAAWALQYGIAVAKAHTTYPGSKLTGFEFGNEPNLYPSENIFGNPAAPGQKTVRPPNYSWPDLVRDWKPYIAAFKGNAITRAFPLIGPAYDTSNNWINLSLGSFLDGVGPANLGIATVHEYPTGTCSKQQAEKLTIPVALSQRLMNRYESEVTANRWISTATGRGLPLQLDETNLTACSNKAGVNDVFAISLWGLDWLFTSFKLGFSRINFYMYNDDYSVVHAAAKSRSDGAVRYATLAEPLYYAMYAFSHNAQGKSILPSGIRTRANIKAYAVRSSTSGSVTVFVLNKDLNASGTVVVRPSSAMGMASLLLVKAASLNSKHVAYGGVSFNSDGRLNGIPRAIRIRPAHGSYSFYLPEASIAIVTLNP